MLLFAYYIFTFFYSIKFISHFVLFPEIKVTFLASSKQDEHNNNNTMLSHIGALSLFSQRFSITQTFHILLFTIFPAAWMCCSSWIVSIFVALRFFFILASLASIIEKPLHFWLLEVKSCFYTKRRDGHIKMY